MKTNYLLSTIVVIFIAVVIYNRNVNKKMEEKFNSVIAETKVVNNFFHNSLFFSLKKDLTVINNCEISYNNHEILLSDVLSARKLVLFIDKNVCEVCIENELNLIKKAFSGKESNLLILSNSQNTKYIDYLKKITGINVKIYRLNTQKSIFVEDYEFPILFVIDKNRTASSFFVPNKDLPQFSTEYYNLIKHKFFNKI